MSEPVRLAIVGAGAIAGAYASVLPGTGARLVAVVDPDAARAEALAARHDRVVAFDDLAALLVWGELDAVLVAAPPALHVPITLACVEQGLPVLCEKPFALVPDDARAVLAAAAEAGVVVTMAAKFRSVGDVVAAKALVAAGHLGEVLRFDNVFSSRVDMSRRWNADPLVSGGGVIVDNGTHSVDLARWFLGPITEVLASAGPRVQAVEVEDSATVLLRSASGALGVVELSWSLEHAVDHYVRLIGSEGQLELGWRSSRWRRNGADHWEPLGDGYDKHAALAGQLGAFVAAVRDGAAPSVSGDEIIASVDVIAAAYRSLERDRWVAVDRPRLVGEADHVA